MKDSSPGVLFSIPYEIAAVRPLRQTTRQEREEALKTAYYNTELVPQALIYVDLRTDSGISSLSTAQLAKLLGLAPIEAEMGMAAEGNRALVMLSERFQKVFGFPCMLPVSQGRAASASGRSCMSKKGPLWPGICFFPPLGFTLSPTAGRSST